MELMIDRLMIRGLAVSEREAAQLKEEVGRELGRLLALHGLPAGLGDSIPAAVLAAPAVHLTPGAPVEATARELARSIYLSLYRLG